MNVAGTPTYGRQSAVSGIPGSARVLACPTRVEVNDLQQSSDEEGGAGLDLYRCPRCESLFRPSAEVEWHLLEDHAGAGLAPRSAKTTASLVRALTRTDRYAG
jgi:hypothetical protein